MAKFKKFDKGACGMFRLGLNEVLSKYGAEHGLVLSIGNIRFTETDLRTKLEVKIAGAKSADPNAPTEKLKAVLKMYGLADTFMHPISGPIKLIDYQPRKRKYPFIGLRADGKRFKFTHSSVVAGQMKAAARK